MSSPDRALPQNQGNTVRHLVHQFQMAGRFARTGAYSFSIVLGTSIQRCLQRVAYPQVLKLFFNERLKEASRERYSRNQEPATSGRQPESAGSGDACHRLSPLQYCQRADGSTYERNYERIHSQRARIGRFRDDTDINLSEQLPRYHVL